jgi:RNA polymerase sigma factor (sigma-70 family)
MVYSAALRRLDDADEARDAAQQTFILLARYAARLAPGTVIGGWLYLTTCNQADTLRRTMQRRRLREHRTAHDPALAPARAATVPTDTRWSALAPHLDSALASLPSRLRDAIVLCLLENQPRPLAAAQLGCTPEALAKRITRALEKLRALLARRSSALSAVALAGLLTRHGSEAHAADLASRVLATPLTPVTVTLPFFTWAVRLGFGIVAAGIVGGVVVSARRTSPHHETSETPRAITEAPVASTAKVAVSLAVAHPSPLQVRPVVVYGVPADNPYAPAIAAYAALSMLDQDELRSGRATSPAALAALDVIVRCFAAGRRSPQVDWGVDDGVPVAEAIDHFVPAVYLGEIVGLYADGLLTLTARREVARDMLAFGRHLARDGFLLQLLYQYAATDAGLDHLEAILPELGLAERSTLDASLRALPQGGTLATALAREKTMFLDQGSSKLEGELLTAGVLSPAVSPASLPALAALEAAAPKLPDGSLCAELLTQRPAGTLSDLFARFTLLTAELSTLYAEIAARPEWFADPAHAERRLIGLHPLAQETGKNVLNGVRQTIRVEARLAGFRTSLGASPAP